MSEFAQSGIQPSGGGSASSVSVSNFPAVQTITGSVGVSGITFPVTQSVVIPGNVAVTVQSPVSIITTGTLNVSQQGQLSVNNFPAFQAVSGSMSVFTTGSLLVTGSVGITNMYMGVPALSTGVAINPPPNMMAMFGYTVSLTGSLSASNYQALPLVSDFQGNLANREQYAPVAEDNVNGVIAVAMLPLSGSAYTPIMTGSMGVLPGAQSTGVIKASPGVVYKVWVTNRNAALRYFQLFNNTTGPSGVPVATWLLDVQAVAQAAPSTLIDLSPWGVAFSIGISAGFSTSNATYTAAAGADCDSVVIYK